MDDLAKIDYNAERLEIDIEKGNSLDHHRITRIKKKGIANRKCAKTTRVCMDDGLPANSVVTEKLIFREHFGAQLAGTVLPFKALLDKDRIDSLNVTCDASCAEGITECLPGCSELSHFFARSSKGACGENNLPGCIARRFPRLFSFLYFPLVLKSHCRVTPLYNGEEESSTSCLKIKDPPLIVSVIVTSC